MQEAEASMAEDKGVPVVRLDCSEVEGGANWCDFEKMAGWEELLALGAQAQNKAMFAAIDTDGDGFITHAELTAYYTKEFGDTEEDAKEEAKSMIERFDANKDGKISKEEFRKAFKECL